MEVFVPVLAVQAAEESGFTTLSVKAVKEVVSMGPRVSPYLDCFRRLNRFLFDQSMVVYHS